LIVGVGIGKLYGTRAGALALAALALTFPEAEAPKWAWLAVLVTAALVRALPPGLRLLGRAARLARLVAWVGLIVAAIPFAVAQVRAGVHPALAPPEENPRYERLLTLGGAGAPDEPPGRAQAERLAAIQRQMVDKLSAAKSDAERARIRAEAEG